MYRGIIQEGTWVGEGSYLRGVVKERGFDKFVQKGRIYRIYHEEETPGPKPRLLNKSARELLSFLSHQNGWWRMTAQKLLVVKADKSVVPDLKKMALDNEGFFAGLFHPDKDFGLERLHALWTLEGLQSTDVPTVKKALQDKDPRVRAAAIRLCEPYLKQNNGEVYTALKKMASDNHPEVIQQLLLTFRLRQEETKPLVTEIVKRFPGNELIKVTAKENLNPAFSQIHSLSEQYKLKGGETATQIINGFRIFQDNCAACHGIDGGGTPQLAPPLAGSPRLKGDPAMAIRILLHGLTGPVDGKTYNGPMAPQAGYSDEELADVLSYVREHLNGSGTIWRGNIRRVREKYKDRTAYWTMEELAKDTALNK
jgi:mono/diheme cytochrome c family protein